MSGSSRLVQLAADGRRAVAIVDEPLLRIIEPHTSAYDLAIDALSAGEPLAAFIRARVGSHSIAYDDVYHGRTNWRFLPAFDHPADPGRCTVSGTGLTHRRSVDTRQSMHGAAADVTDSMRMYQLGLEGGRPAAGAIGATPEWFYKGNGLALHGHGEPLVAPAWAEDAGEEPEIAGAYVIDSKGTPRRVGMAIGNEFADHRLERRNYLYLAHSKLRVCALGPELVLDPDFSDVHGEVAIERDGDVLWSHPIRSGDAAMCHSLQNLEHHHFKYEMHRRPGDVHIHFLGADAFSFGAGIELGDGDIMRIRFDGFGRPLQNPVSFRTGPDTLAQVQPL
ncbi:MAG: AraD1 family protein [Gemmatimonadota bacterium]